jgi:hypothetical protein
LDLAPDLKRPLDLGWAPGGVRLLGDNKTLRGALAMFAGTLGATAALHRAPWYRTRLDPALIAAGPWRHGAALGVAVVAGELPNSFVKRRLGIGPGEHAGASIGLALSLYDQIDFLPLAALLLRPQWRMSAAQLAEACAVVAAAHAAVNVAGHAVGARTSPL